MLQSRDIINGYTFFCFLFQLTPIKARVKKKTYYLNKIPTILRLELLLLLAFVRERILRSHYFKQ